MKSMGAWQIPVVSVWVDAKVWRIKKKYQKEFTIFEIRKIFYLHFKTCILPTHTCMSSSLLQVLLPTDGYLTHNCSWVFLFQQLLCATVHASSHKQRHIGCLSSCIHWCYFYFMLNNKLCCYHGYIGVQIEKVSTCYSPTPNV